MWNFPRVLAHRGGGKLAPENTIAALRCGLAHGFHAVEFDVMLTQDGVPVLVHDPLLGRTISGTGAIAELTFAELQQRDAGGWFSAEYAGERVPSLLAALEFCQQHRIWMNIEIKPSPGTEIETGRVVAQAVAQFYAKQEAQPQLPLFSSFALEAVAQAKIHAPHIPRAALFEQVPQNWLAELQSLQAVALHTNHKVLDRDLAQQIKQAGYGLFCYTVNDAVRAREIVAWGVDGFCTDRIDVLGADFI